MTYTTLLSSHDFAQLIEFFNENFRSRTFLNRVAKTAAFTQWAGDVSGTPEEYYSCTGTYVATLVAASATDAAAGRVTHFKNAGSGSITLTPDGSDTIGGLSGLVLAAGEAASIISDAVSDWEILST